MKKFNRKQLIEMFVKDEKTAFEWNDEDVKVIRSEYDRQLKKLGIKEGTFKLLGVSDGDVVYDLGDVIVGVDGQYLMRYLYIIDDIDEIELF